MDQERFAAEIYGRDFPAGAVVFEEGDPGSRMYVIQAGRVRILRRVGTRAVTLAVLAPGEAFGEMALLDGRPRSATALVEEAARLIEIDEAAFGDLVRRNGEVALRLLRRLSGRLREANRQVRNFLSADAMGRAVEVLRALAGPAGDDGFRPVPADLGPDDLALRAGVPGDGAGLWARLRRARLLREVGGRAALAPEEVVGDFLHYVELAPRWRALASDALAEAGALDDARREVLLSELLGARLTPEGAEGSPPLVREHAEWLELSRRFDPDRSEDQDS